MTKRAYCNLRLLRVYFETSGSVHGRCGTSISEKVKLSERKYLPKTLTGFVNPLDRSYAAAGERTRLFTGLKMGRKLLFTMIFEIIF